MHGDSIHLSLHRSSTLNDNIPAAIEVAQDKENDKNDSVFKKPPEIIVDKTKNIEPKAELTNAKLHLETVVKALESRREAEDKFEEALEELADVDQNAPIDASEHYARMINAYGEHLKTAPLEIDAKPLNQDELMQKALEIAKNRKEQETEYEKYQAGIAELRKEVEAREKKVTALALHLKKMLDLDKD